MKVSQKGSFLSITKGLKCTKTTIAHWKTLAVS